jgi:hypothetical protein
LAHVRVGEPVPTPDQVRRRLSPEHALLRGTQGKFAIGCLGGFDPAPHLGVTSLACVVDVLAAFSQKRASNGDRDHIMAARRACGIGKRDRAGKFESFGMVVSGTFQGCHAICPSSLQHTGYTPPSYGRCGRRVIPTCTVNAGIQCDIVAVLRMSASGDITGNRHSLMVATRASIDALQQAIQLSIFAP